MLTGAEFDTRLVVGDRRQGVLLYKTACPECHACQPIRIDVAAFRPGRTQRRVLRRGREEISVQLGPPQLTDEKVALYNAHKFGRGLNSDDKAIDHEGYRVFLADTCCESFEIRYRRGDQLLGVAVTDRGADSLSAVYSYFDPAFEALSPGVFSILTQIELCQRWKLRYLYLGLYIADCKSMAYKARYRPHERLIDGEWIVVER
jgi:arginine-tRNA-protein transferase